MALLEISGIKVNYGKVRALKEVTLSIGEGEFVGLIGPNGAGKSTLLDTISGLTSNWSGKIMFDGIDVSSYFPSQRIKLGLVHCPERRHLFPYMTVKENLLMGAYNKRARAVIGENMDLVFGLFPVLKDRQNDLSNTLSGGQSQMLALGRALMSNPRLLMLDEPGLGVAPVMKNELSKALKNLKKKNISVLITEQEIFLTVRNTDMVFIINDGMIIEKGTPDDLKKEKDLRELYFV
jgi:branched-chain amino acid transport system ATP-binding protein